MGRQLALRRGSPDRAERPGERGPKEDTGTAGDGAARTNRPGAGPLARPATGPGPGVESAPPQGSFGHRPVRPGRQDPKGRGPAVRRARGHTVRVADAGPGDVGETAGPARFGGVGGDVGGRAVAGWAVRSGAGRGG